MKTDISRWSLNQDKQYSGVYQQQGRMISDADWNELVEILKLQVRDALNHVVGGGAPLQLDDKGKPLDSELVDATGKIRGGTIYVDGIRAILRQCDFTAQPDFPGAPEPPQSGCVFYVDVWERTVTGVEDDALMDPGLNGADTCSRTQTLAQVKWFVKEPDWKRMQKGTAVLSATQDDTNLLGEGGTGGTVFRIEVHDVQHDVKLNATKISLKWSMENGAEHYRVGDEPPHFWSEDRIYEFYSDASEKHLGVQLMKDFKLARVEPIRVPTKPSIEMAEKIAKSLLIEGGDPFVRRWDGYCSLAFFSAGGWLVVNDLSSGYLTLDRAKQEVLLSMPFGKIALALPSFLKPPPPAQFIAGDYWLAAIRDGHVDIANAGLPVGIDHHYLELPAAKDPPSARFRFPTLPDLAVAFEKVQGVVSGVIVFQSLVPNEPRVSGPINPGLDKGPLVVQLALTDGGDGISAGDASFRKVVYCANVNGEKGTFTVAVNRLDGPPEDVRLRWWAQQKSRDYNDVITVPRIWAEPASVTLDQGATRQFKVMVSGKEAPEFTWSGDCVDSNGLFTARSDQIGEKTYTLSATNPSYEQTATATVVVREVTLKVSPASVTCSQGKQIQFVAEVTGAHDRTVGWDYQATEGEFGAPGGITENGLFTAIESSKHFDTYGYVWVTSKGNPNVRCSVYVTVKRAIPGL